MSIINLGWLSLGEVEKSAVWGGKCWETIWINLFYKWSDYHGVARKIPTNQRLINQNVCFKFQLAACNHYDDESLLKLQVLCGHQPTNNQPGPWTIDPEVQKPSVNHEHCVKLGWCTSAPTPFSVGLPIKCRTYEACGHDGHWKFTTMRSR